MNENKVDTVKKEEFLNKWQEFQTKASDIENIIDKLNVVIDVDDYLEELRIIKSEVNIENTLNTDLITNLSLVIPKLDQLKKKIENEVLPFYHMYLLHKNIKLKIDDNENGIDEAINNSKELINLLNSLGSIIADNNKLHNRDDLKRIYDNCLEAIYLVIVNEQIYDRTDLIKEILDNENNRIIKEKLVKYLRRDLEDLKKKKVINEELENISEGLSYDSLSISVIDDIIENKYASKKEEFYERKEVKRNSLKKRIFDYQNEQSELAENGNSLIKSIKNIKLHRRINRAKLSSYVLVPLLVIGIGIGSGIAFSNTIDEYRTITRVVNPNNQQIVEVISDTYDEKENTYTSTIKVYEPWKKNSVGSGYVRNVIAYVTDPKKGYDLEANPTEKYHYLEAKDQLDSNDSTTESIVLVTETIQDKNDTRKSKKYVLGFSIGAVILAVAIDALIAANMGTYDILSELEKLKRNLEEKKITKNNLENERTELNEEGNLLNTDIATSSKVYQFAEEEFPYVKEMKKTW
jgi:hypothetical protein